MLFYYRGSVALFEVRYCDTSSFALFAEYCLSSYSRSLVFPNELQVDFSIFVMNDIGILIGIELVECFW
jgi:hypothetical protein